MSADVREAQVRLYGEPLGDMLARCGRVLGLNQSRLAAALGISAPMLSQLVNGHRVKIANPVAAHRLQVMHAGVAEVERGDLDAVDALARIDEVRGGDTIFTTKGSARTGLAADVQGVFRMVASAQDYLSAADLLEPTLPDVAEMLRTYGAGRTGDAVTHLSGLADRTH